MDSNALFQRTVLDNGIRIVTERMPFVRSVAIGVWVEAGSVHETRKNNGISHFLEHMLFKGTERRSAEEIARSLESLGGGINGSTGKEFSIYSAQVLDENVDVAVDVLVDLIQNPKFDPADIELEKNVVLAEISHAKEDPEELLMDHFYQNIFPRHPLGYFIYGSEKNVQKFTRQDLIAYRNSLYTPDRFIFAAAGNVDHQKFVDLVAKNVSSPAVEARRRKIPAPPPPRNGLCPISMNNFQQAHICLGVRTFGFCDERRYALVLLDVLLGGGMSSRLFQNIREKYGFAYSVYSFVDFMRMAGIFGVYMACAYDHVDQSLELLREELRDVARNTISEDELDRIKSQVKGNIILGLESSARRMRKIGENEFYNYPHHDLDYVLDKIAKIRPQDLNDIASEYFDDSQICTTVLKPTHH